MMENGASDNKDPSGFLSEIIGAPVTVKLNSSIVYKGNTSKGVDNFGLLRFLNRFII